MSKSYGNTLPIFGTREAAASKKVMRLVTDSTPVEDPKTDGELDHPGALQLVADSEADPRQWRPTSGRGGIGYGDFKKRLLEALHGFFAPIRREAREDRVADPGYVEEVLRPARSGPGRRPG